MKCAFVILFRLESETSNSLCVLPVALEISLIISFQSWAHLCFRVPISIPERDTDPEGIL